MKVSVENQPIRTTESDISEVRDIINETKLNFEETYESSYLDIREYRHATFYVIPRIPLNEPHAEVRYQLDAFFSADLGANTVKIL